MNRRSLANQERHPSPARSVRSRSPASRSLARCAPFCIFLHLSHRAQLSHTTCIAPHPACALPRLAPRKCQLSLNFLSVSARSHRPSLTSPRSRPAGGSINGRNARDSQERAQDGAGSARWTSEKPGKKKKKKPRFHPRRDACCPACVCPPSQSHSCRVVRIACTSRPWQCYRASVFVRKCNAMSHVCMCVSVSRVGSFSS